jgi:hypothetical protein
MSIESDRALLSGGSGEESEPCGTSEEGPISIESGRAPLSCSNVANVAKTVRAALEALDVGRVDVARERLVEVLEALGK